MTGKDVSLIIQDLKDSGYKLVSINLNSNEGYFVNLSNITVAYDGIIIETARNTLVTFNSIKSIEGCR